MEIFINGKSRNLSESVVDTMEAQFKELKETLKGDDKISEWLAKFNGNNDGIKSALKQAKFFTLGTEAGVAFLKEKFSCPSSGNRSH